MSSNHVCGAVILRDGRTAPQSFGIGHDQRIQELVADKKWMADARRRRLLTLTLGERSYMALLIPVPDGEVILLSEAQDCLLDFIGSVDFSYDILSYLITNPFEAMTVVDADSNLVYVSPVHEEFFGFARGEAAGRPVASVIENTRLDKVVKSGKAEIGALQKMRGIERVVSRIPLRRGNTIVGAIGRIMFKGPEQLQEISRQLGALQSQVEFYQREAASLRRQTYGLDAIIGESQAIKKLRSEILKLAPLDTSILILGETGTGKELIAHALHALSKRQNASLVTLNASAMPSALVEAELFGYEAGAFTGADRKGRKGKFEQANGGTIFLDEIGDMAVEVQPKLLRVLQNRMVERVGGEKSKEIDFRLISATNADLRAQVSASRFRLDLYYRISVVTIEAPPLRSRREDIPLLVEHFLHDLSARHNRPMPAITDRAMNFLMDQKWPGNVRQLRHEIERAFVLCDTETIDAHSFSDFEAEAHPVKPEIPVEGGISMKQATDLMEGELIRSAMKRHRGNKKKVAEELGISRSYLYKKLEADSTL